MMKNEILELEQRWVSALLQGDADTLDQMYDEAIVYTHTNATMDTKASYLAKIRNRDLVYHTLERSEIDVRIFGATALAACRWVQTSTSGGVFFEVNARYLHVYAYVDGRWLMVAHQSTKIV
ncbi:MAG: nuclear transport factor 2 family protein [Acidobacteria bacterium]|nr:nuclear transport factor 2 family protein [Acidobacteriota bacterium]